MRAMRLLQQHIIDGDFPKLIDDNGKACIALGCQETREQGRLP
jgi:hypothetical protein